jgi:hypothetical protein
MDTIPLLIRFKRRMPDPIGERHYDEAGAVSVTDQDGTAVPFVRTAMAANALKSMMVKGAED